MKIYRYFFVAAFSLLVMTGCLKKNFLDVNDDPNRVTDNKITANLLFPQAAHAAGSILVGSRTNFVSYLYNWVGYYSIVGGFNLPGQQTVYNLDASYTEPVWAGYYNALFDLSLVKQKAIEGADTVLAGASMVLSSKLWQELVDMFGNVPYSEAFQNSATRFPRYDRDKDIYTSLQKTLDTAVGFLKKAPRSSLAASDVVNHGNTTLWIKLANTLKLRLLIHESEVPGLKVTAEIAKITANGGVLHAGETVSVNPGYTNDAGKQNPYYANWGYTVTGIDVITSERANTYIVNILKNTSDPRLTRFFLPVGSDVVGTVYGLANGNPDGAHSSKVGPGLVKSASQDQWIMPSFESLFLEAEAISRGWLPGDAQTAFENAIRESFVWLGVPDAVNAANSYIAANASASWANAGSTVLSKARFIAYQKYIALTGVDPLEAWTDIRRLGFLPPGYISVNPARVSNTLPLRLPYAQSEYTTNNANVSAEGPNNIFTHKIFWQP